MTLGEKIKAARLEQKLTQAELCRDKITRNMLSAIESGKAMPSLETLEFLAKELCLPLPYFLSEENDLPFFMKKERMPAIKKALETKNYNACISLILKLDVLDDELNYILAICYFELGIHSAKIGSLQSSEKYLKLCSEYCNRTLYDTKRYESVIPLYLAITHNVNSPLLEFEEDKFVEVMKDAFDYEFYKYLTLDYEFPFKDPRYSKHIQAKILIKERKYKEASLLLLNIEDTKSEYEYNSYLMFCVYTDLETCFKQLFDFESAYRYASKRISLLEGFNL